VLAEALATKYTDTRKSVTTFRAAREVVEQLAQASKSVLVMDGVDLVFILERPLDCSKRWSRSSARRATRA
jgi:hypothetical protein